jgi:hypothetical protein
MPVGCCSVILSCICHSQDNLQNDESVNPCVFVGIVLALAAWCKMLGCRPHSDTLSLSPHDTLFRVTRVIAIVYSVALRSLLMLSILSHYISIHV